MNERYDMPCNPTAEANRERSEVSQKPSAMQVNQELSKGDWLRLCRAPKPDVALMATERAEANEEGDLEQQSYTASRLVGVGEPHPDWLTEPIVAGVSPPRLPDDFVLRLPSSIATDGRLSSPQLETVAYAVLRFGTQLPGGERAGFLLGDSAGCGSGRVIAAIMWHLWNSGVRRHVWLSEDDDLLVDIKRDFEDIGAELPISCLSKWSLGSIGANSGLDCEGDGVIFASYSFMAGSSGSTDSSPETSRAAQLIDWMNRGRGGARGLVAFDEAHRAPFFRSEDTRSISKISTSILQLSSECPQAAILYSIPTGVSDIRSHGFLDRLGLWGTSCPYKTFEHFRGAVECGGLAMTELVAMSLRAEGALSCRSLSFRHSTVNLREVGLSMEKQGVYSAACGFWQRACQLMKSLVASKKQQARIRRVKTTHLAESLSMDMKHFWNCQQRFFRLMLLCAKVDEAVNLAVAARKRGDAVVISLWSTADATSTAPSNEGLLGRSDVVSVAGSIDAPEDIGRRMLDKVLRPLTDGPRRLAELERLREDLAGVRLPPHPLDDLVSRLGGPSEVADLTGRLQKTGGSFEERMAFQSGRKKIAVVTGVGSVGTSLHADKRLPLEAQRPRHMITIEIPWQTEKAIHQLRCVHQSNQRVSPSYDILVTDLGGEARFVSAVGRRLRCLGAAMEGCWNLTEDSAGSIASQDMQQRYGRIALSRLQELIRTKGEPEVVFSFMVPGTPVVANKRRWPTWGRFCDEASKAFELIGLKVDADDRSDEVSSESRTLGVVLSRLLMLESGIQNALFDALAELLVHFAGCDRDFFADTGVEVVGRQRGHTATVVEAKREVLSRNPQTGAEITYSLLRIDRGISWHSALETLKLCEPNAGGFYWHRDGTRSEQVVLAVARSASPARGGSLKSRDEDDSVFDLHQPHGVSSRRSRLITRDTLRGPQFRRASEADRCHVERSWRRQHSASAGGRWAEEHVVSGNILSAWASALAFARPGKPTRIPLVRAVLADGSTILGVRVRLEQVEEMRRAAPPPSSDVMLLQEVEGLNAPVLAASEAAMDDAVVAGVRNRQFEASHGLHDGETHAALVTPRSESSQGITPASLVAAKEASIMEAGSASMGDAGMQGKGEQSVTFSRCSPSPKRRTVPTSRHLREVRGRSLGCSGRCAVARRLPM